MFSEFGRIGLEMLLRFTPSGMAVATITLAYEYGRKRRGPKACSGSRCGEKQPRRCLST